MRLFPALFCCVLLESVPLGAFDSGIQEIGAELSFKPEYHRSFGYCQQFAATGEALLQDSYSVHGGLALGQTGDKFDLGIFLAAGYRFPIPLDLKIRLAYLYNVIPGYRHQTNTLFPSLSYLGRWGGFDLGPSLRFTEFNQEFPILEPILSFRAFVRLLRRERIGLLAGIGNFSAFTMGNLGAYYLFLENQITLKEGSPSGFFSMPHFKGRPPRVSFINRLDLCQTGSIGLTSTFQGFAWQGGLRLSW
jgi:hypothetical protein